MFLALFALYSPPSSIAAYIPLLKPFNAEQRLRLAIGLFVNGRIEPRLSKRGRELFDRLAGILLTAIAFTLLASGVTRLITDVLHNVSVL